MADFMRVYFADDSWTTVSFKGSDTVDDLCKMIMKKRNALDRAQDDEYDLYMVESSSSNQVFERRLDRSESPYNLHAKARSLPRTDHIRFVFKSRAENPDDTALFDGSGSEDENIFGTSTSELTPEEYDKCGFLEKRGKRNTAWRERWFILRDRKLSYHRSPNHPPIAFIPIHEAAISLLPNDNRLFSIDTKQRMFYLRARSAIEAHQWVRELQKQTNVVEENERLDMIQTSIQSLELERAEVEEQFMKNISTLRGVLTTGVALDWFMTSVVENHCEENLLFWTMAEDYRLDTSRSQEMALQIGKRIYSRFIKVGAEFEIALNRETREKVRLDLDSGDPDRTCFCSAQAKTIALLEASQMPVYCEAIHFRQALMHRPVSKAQRRYLENNPYRMQLRKPKPYGKNRNELKTLTGTSSGINVNRAPLTKSSKIKATYVDKLSGSVGAQDGSIVIPYDASCPQRLISSSRSPGPHTPSSCGSIDQKELSFQGVERSFSRSLSDPSEIGASDFTSDETESFLPPSHEGDNYRYVFWDESLLLPSRKVVLGSPATPRSGSPSVLSLASRISPGFKTPPQNAETERTKVGSGARIASTDSSYAKLKHRGHQRTMSESKASGVTRSRAVDSILRESLDRESNTSEVKESTANSSQLLMAESPRSKAKRRSKSISFRRRFLSGSSTSATRSMFDEASLEAAANKSPISGSEQSIDDIDTSLKDLEAIGVL